MKKLTIISLIFSYFFCLTAHSAATFGYKFQYVTGDEALSLEEFYGKEQEIYDKYNMALRIKYGNALYQNGILEVDNDKALSIGLSVQMIASYAANEIAHNAAYFATLIKASEIVDHSAISKSAFDIVHNAIYGTPDHTAFYESFPKIFLTTSSAISVAASSAVLHVFDKIFDSEKSPEIKAQEIALLSIELAFKLASQDENWISTIVQTVIKIHKEKTDWDIFKTRPDIAKSEAIKQIFADYTITDSDNSETRAKKLAIKALLFPFDFSNEHFTAIPYVHLLLHELDQNHSLEAIKHTGKAYYSPLQAGAQTALEVPEAA